MGRIPWRRKCRPTPLFLPGKSHGQRSLEGYSPWGCKESDVTEVTNTISFHRLSLFHFRWSLGIVRSGSRLQLLGYTPSLSWMLVVWGQGGVREGHPSSRMREAQSSSWRDPPSHTLRILSESLSEEALKLRLKHATDPFLNPGPTRP